MKWPNENIVKQIKAEYPEGTRVELVQMDDPCVEMVPGLKGTVAVVDDTGTIHVNWDNGIRLGVVYGEDSCKKLEN